MKNGIKIVFILLLSIVMLTGCEVKKQNDDLISGEWKMHVDDNTTDSRYYKFENDKFWWYKTSTDLNDNYWYGSSKIMRGQEALDYAGIDDKEFDYEYSKNGIKKENYFVLILTPEKLINDGNDDSSSIPEDASWKLLWVVNNEDSKNVTASIVYMSNYSTAVYDKVK